MSDEEPNEQSDDQSTTEAAGSDQQTSEDQPTEERAGPTANNRRQSNQTTDVEAAGDTGVAAADDDCSGWFSDPESISKRAAEFYVRNELTGNRGMVEKIDVHDRGDPVSYSCMAHFSDKTTNIEVVVFRDKIIAREDLPGISERLTCWYDY